jgi:hypothetical protein
LSDEGGVVSSGGKKIPSLLEKLVDWKFLVLLLSFFLYLDIWFLRTGLDPTILTLESGYKAAKNVSVFTALIFALSYSLLMAGFFPVLRKIIGFGQIYIRSSVTLSNNQLLEDKRLSDWSIAFIVLSVYDATIGYFFVESGYKGLAAFVLNFLQSDSFEVVIFRFCVAFLWFVCLSHAFEVDEPH